MRTFSQIQSRFWIGGTGKQIVSSGAETTVMALYVMTSPHSHMSGISYIPVSLIASETNLEIDDVYSCLDELEKLKFSKYDTENQILWVINMAEFQANLTCKSDKKYKHTITHLKSLPKCKLLMEFADYYGIDQGEIATGATKIMKGHTKGHTKGHGMGQVAIADASVQSSTVLDVALPKTQKHKTTKTTDNFMEARHVK